MNRSTARAWVPVVEAAMLWVVLVLLLAATYATFFRMPYYGFFLEINGQVGDIFAPSALQRGDRVRQIGEVHWEDFAAGLRVRFFEGVEAGQAIPILVERDGRSQHIDYVFPGPTTDEVLQRLFNIWPLPYAFWIIGAATLLVARPKDTTWRLLIAFNFLTALWLAVGPLSSRHVGESAVWLRVLIWLSVPVYVHLHLVFPRPLIRLPRLFWIAAYGIAVLVAAAQWLEWLQPGLYFSGFLVAIVGSLALLVVHHFRQTSERTMTGFVLRAVGFAFFPSIALVVFAAFTGITAPAGGSLLFLPIVSIAYSYAIYRHRLGGLELRVNRAISIYLFFVFLGATALVVLPLIALWVVDPLAWVAITLASIFVVSLLTLYAFDRFRRFVERRFLNIRIPPTGLLEAYAAQITSTSDIGRLIEALRDDVAQSLLIRQSALLRYDRETLVPLYVAGVQEEALPIVDVPLRGVGGRYLPAEAGASQPGLPGWIRVVLPLSIETRTIGYWLLGRRDPDDFYSVDDIAILTTLANQTAMALHNIMQTRRLHTLYQNDIDQREAERASLARELHDQVLNELGLLWRTASQGRDVARMGDSFERLTTSLRQTITGLRPAAVDFGLRLALADLVDRATNGGPVIELDVDEAGDAHRRYPTNVELHVYRIVQQALANALRYAGASRIVLGGRLGPEGIDLSIRDDGIGFEVGENPDVAQLVAQKHFGVASMCERAQLIGARLSIQSGPGKGTCVRVAWSQERFESTRARPPDTGM